MCTEQGDSVVKNALKSLCCENGWSYGVFWSFDQTNSLLLTVQETYFDEQMGAVVDDMCLQVQMLGGGIIGEAAFSKKHRWMFSDARYVEQKFAESVGRCDFFQDDSEFQYQYASGIKTIAVIPVEPQGVLQFGSTQQIPENEDFVNLAKRVFSQMASCHGLNVSEYLSPSSRYESYGFSGLFPSLVPSGSTDVEDNKFHESDGFQGLTASTCFPADSIIMKMENCNDHWQSDGTESQVHQTICSGAWSAGLSTLTSLKHQGSALRSQPPYNMFNIKPETAVTCGDTVRNCQGSAFTSLNNSQCSSGSLIKLQYSTPPLHSIDSELLGKNSVQTLNEIFESPNYTTDHIKACSMDSFYQWFDSSLDQTNKTDFTTMDDDLLSEAMRFVSQPYNVSGGTNAISHPASSVHSSVTNTSTSTGKQQCPNVFKVENDLFDRFGVDLGYGQAGNTNDILMPVIDGGQMDFKNALQSISQQHVGSGLVHRKGLFSKLGIEQIVESVSTGTSSSVAKTTFEDQLSSTSKRKRTGISLGTNDHLASSLFQQKEDTTTRGSCSWVSDSYRTLDGHTDSQEKKHVSTAKTMKKKAKPGARPRPKDRQLIQDRLLELRELTPNGEKMSIDCLLDRTIKYMLFLQSVTKHAETLKEADKIKENEIFNKDNFSSRGGGVTWACEYGYQSTVCPLLVEDLSSPGQMLIEMLCEEQGFFLEIVDIIRGLGLTILKGVMEVQENKIWARFIVEPEGNRRVSRHEIFSTLIQLLQLTPPSGVKASKQVGNIMDGGANLFNNYPQCGVSVPLR
ncbi:transcription factor bHLH157-like [Apium graveolens]|uniref:transcription factor bHLH157-like n=1 Tax=Apium graveolens TaxID=4045 RepID=UPI003D79804D